MCMYKVPCCQFGDLEHDKHIIAVCGDFKAWRVSLRKCKRSRHYRKLDAS